MWLDFTTCLRSALVCRSDYDDGDHELHYDVTARWYFKRLYLSSYSIFCIIKLHIHCIFYRFQKVLNLAIPNSTSCETYWRLILKKHLWIQVEWLFSLNIVILLWKHTHYLFNLDRQSDREFFLDKRVVLLREFRLM